MKVILHIDLNSFFATVEQILDPTTVGKPLVVAHYKSLRGVVTTASYEARALGAHAGMPIFKIKQIEKEKGIKFEYRSSGYHHYSQYAAIFFNFLAKNYTDKIEIGSIDECYLDATDIWQEYGSAANLAQDIIDRLQKETKLKCSIGVSYNKFLAKMASDMKKPLGYTLLNKRNLEDVLWPLPIKDFFGVGKATRPKLEAVGVHTIGDLAKSMDNHDVRKILGKSYMQYILNANGEGDDKVDLSHNELKSVGNSVTSKKDLATLDEIRDFIKNLAAHVSMRCTTKDLKGKNISVTIKSYDFKVITRQTMLDDYTDDENIILKVAMDLIEENWDGRPVRLVGVSLNHIINKYKIAKQLSLFNQDPLDMISEVEKIIRRQNAAAGVTNLMTAKRYLDTKDKKYQSRYLEKEQTDWRLENQ